AAAGGRWLCDRAEAGLDAGGRVHEPRRRRRQPRPGRDEVRARARRTRRDRRARPHLRSAVAVPRYGLVVRLSPVLTATGTYPFVRLDQAKRRLQAEGVDL